MKEKIIDIQAYEKTEHNSGNYVKEMDISGVKDILIDSFFEKYNYQEAGLNSLLKIPHFAPVVPYIKKIIFLRIVADKDILKELSFKIEGRVNRVSFDCDANYVSYQPIIFLNKDDKTGVILQQFRG